MILFGYRSTHNPSTDCSMASLVVGGLLFDIVSEFLVEMKKMQSL